MVPSNWGEVAGWWDKSKWVLLGTRRGEKREKLVYSQPPLMDRNNRGELRERGEKTEERKRVCVKELVGRQQSRGTAGVLTHSVVVM